MVSDVKQGDKLIQGNEKAKDEEEEEEGPYSAWWCSITTRVRYGKVDRGYNHTSYG